MEDFKINLIDVKGQSKGRNPIFDVKYPNLYLCAKKHSGKTMLIYNMLRKVVGKNTDLYIFCSTATRDPTWKQMIEEFGDKGNKVEVYDSIYDSKMLGKVKRKFNNLELLIKSFTKNDDKKRDRPRASDKKKKKQKGGGVRPNARGEGRIPKPFDRIITKEMLGENHIHNLLFRDTLFKKSIAQEGQGEETPEKEIITKPNKKGVLYPDKIIIFDDLSEQIKDPYISALLKKNRHFKSMVIVSTQFPNDLPPSSRSQFDYVFCWGGHNAKKQNVIRRMCDTNLDEDEFSKLYHYATKEKYNFMLCDCRNNQFRKNFNELIYK